MKVQTARQQMPPAITQFYMNQYFFLPLNRILTFNTLHTVLDISYPPPEHNGGHDWDMTPLPPHGGANKHK